MRHHDDERILAFERSDIRDAWQLPQGGLDHGEEPVDAAWRELGEEAGLGPADVELVGEHPDWVVYEVPSPKRGGKIGRGQVQRWFTFRARRSDIEPTPDGKEFRDWRWVEAEWLVGHVVEFRRPGYRRVLRG